VRDEHRRLVKAKVIELLKPHLVSLTITKIAALSPNCDLRRPIAAPF
jgi:hypothetical protein